MRIPDRLDAPSRHDALLAAMPPAFLLTYLLGQRVFASEAAAVGMAALTSAAFIVDGLFRHPPRGESGE